MSSSLGGRLRALVARISDRESYERHAMVGPPSAWREKRQFQIDFLKSQGLRPHHKLVDIGCGTLRGGVPLVRYLDVGNYVGLDVRPEALEEGRHELERNGLSGKGAELLVSDDFDRLTCDRMFDFAWAFCVLIHMTDEICSSAMRWVAGHLSPAGVLYADVKVGDRREGLNDRMGRAFPVMTRPLDTYQEMAGDVGLSLEDMGTIASLGHRTGLSGDERHMLRLRPTGGS